MIPYGKHSVDQSDVDAVVDILENHFLTQGPKSGEFEAALCEMVGAEYATVVNSGTSALHVACLGLGLGDNDILWTVPNSFVASANCALYCGSSVDFVDIDPDTRNICPEALERKLIIAQQEKKLPKALVVVHFAGLSCDMHVIQNLTDKYGISLIEDASHALGAAYRDKPVGNCEYSDICVFSFHPVKSITAAEGGAVMCNRPELAKLMSSFAKHGITKDQQEFSVFNGEPWGYEQHRLGYNYRLSDLHAALGLNQLKRLHDFVEKRESIAKYYQQNLVSLPVKLPIVPAYAKSAWHLFVIELLQHDREIVFKRLRESGILVNVHYIPIHTQPYYQNLGFKNGDFPNSEAYYDKAISLPIFPSLTEQQQDHVISVLSEVLV